VRGLLPFLIAGACLAQAPAAKDPLAPLAFLEGAWDGVGTGAPGEGSGGFAFAREAGGKILVRRNHADYPATKERPAFHHEDLMVVFPEGGALKADYFDNEGHVIHYAIAAEGEAACFLSEGPGPRFRLGYRKSGPDTVAITFEIAAPGKDFAPYIQAKAKRKP
jgi:hypothetical protein